MAVDSENFEVIELLLDKLNFECIEEALLHSISKGLTKIVKVIHNWHQLLGGGGRAAQVQV